MLGRWHFNYHYFYKIPSSFGYYFLWLYLPEKLRSQWKWNLQNPLSSPMIINIIINWHCGDSWKNSPLILLQKTIRKQSTIKLQFCVPKSMKNDENLNVVIYYWKWNNCNRKHIHTELNCNNVSSKIYSSLRLFPHIVW